MSTLVFEDLESFSIAARLERSVAAGATSIRLRAILVGVETNEVMIVDSEGTNPEWVTVTAQDNRDLTLSTGLAYDHEGGSIIIRQSKYNQELFTEPGFPGSANAGGLENVIGADYSSILGGYGAVTTIYGEHAHAAGYFAAAGDAQYKRIILRKLVPHGSSAWVNLQPDGTGAVLPVPTDTVWNFECLIVGTTEGCTKSFAFKVVGIIENDDGTVSLLASTVTTIYDTDDESFDARANANDTTNKLEIQMQDSDGGGDTVRWVAVLKLVQVRF